MLKSRKLIALLLVASLSVLGVWRLTAGAPTLAALGPLGRLARLDQVAARLAA